MGTNPKERTLCWTCRNAVGRCNWSKYGKHVDGWEAEPTKVRAIEKKSGYTDSFLVRKCPLYWED